MLTDVGGGDSAAPPTPREVRSLWGRCSGVTTVPLPSSRRTEPGAPAGEPAILGCRLLLPGDAGGRGGRQTCSCRYTEADLEENLVSTV